MTFNNLEYSVSFMYPLIASGVVAVIALILVARNNKIEKDYEERMLDDDEFIKDKPHFERSQELPPEISSVPKFWLLMSIVTFIIFLILTFIESSKYQF